MIGELHLFRHVCWNCICLRGFAIVTDLLYCRALGLLATIIDCPIVTIPLRTGRLTSMGSAVRSFSGKNAPIEACFEFDVPVTQIKEERDGLIVECRMPCLFLSYHAAGNTTRISTSECRLLGWE